MSLNIPVLKSLVIYKREDERFAGMYGEEKKVVMKYLDSSDYQGSLERIEMNNPFNEFVHDNFEHGHKKQFDTRNSGTITYYKELSPKINLLPIKVNFEIKTVLSMETHDNEIVFLLGQEVENYTTED